MPPITVLGVRISIIHKSTEGCTGLDCDWDHVARGYDEVNLKTGFNAQVSDPTEVWFKLVWHGNEHLDFKSSLGD